MIEDMMRKFKLFFGNNKIWVIMVLVVLILIVLSILGLSKLESFYRIMTIATLPVSLLVAFVNAAAFVFMYMVFFRSGFEQLKRNKIKAGDIAVSFKEVIGLEGAKREALEVIQLIKDRKQLQKIGGEIIKGILLIGPPGCGKTLLAKAIATECKVPFLSMAGSEFIEMFAGVGASRVRNLFKKAREYAYADGACIVFIDEIEVIGRARTFSCMGGGGEETNSTQNQLLVEMDGLDNKKSNVLVIAATNADESVLDKALLRAGRFDRKIVITFPNLKEREQLFDFYLKRVKVAPEVKIDRLAKKAIYKSPADIENIIKEAALIAMRKKKEAIDIKDLSEAMDRIDLGIETHIDMTTKELEMTAYHEAGHATAIYLMHPTDDVFKVTVKSRRGSLGLVAPFPKEDLQVEYREELLSDIMVSLAGYAAEKIKYNTTTTGVSVDFGYAMTTANNMVWKVGMGDGGFIGDFSVIPQEEMSQSLKEKLNNETVSIINSCYAKIEEFLKTNWDAVGAIAEKLISEKELDFDELEEVMETIGKKKPNSIDSNTLTESAE
jgi:cell division protease FtsH